MSSIEEKKVDPELLRQIKAAKKSMSPVAGIFRLKPDDPAKHVNTPERNEELARQVLKRVENDTGENADRVNILRNLGVVMVYGEPGFIEKFINQPEVISGMANSSSGSGKIEPVKKRTVSPSEIGREKVKRAKSDKSDKGETAKARSRNTGSKSSTRNKRSAG